MLEFIQEFALVVGRQQVIEHLGGAALASDTAVDKCGFKTSSNFVKPMSSPELTVQVFPKHTSVFTDIIRLLCLLPLSCNGVKR